MNLRARVCVRFLMVLSTVSNAAFPCGVFDLKVREVSGEPKRVGRGMPGERSMNLPEASLDFAKLVASDAKEVYSDVSFFHIPKFQGDQALTWNINPRDPKIAQQQTMVEIYGFLKHFMEVPDLEKNRDKFFSKAMMDAFQGTSLDCLGRYPTCHDYSIAGVRRGFKKMETLGIIPSYASLAFALTKKNQERKADGFPYFSRPAYLTSRAATEAYGSAGLLLACTTTGYGLDAFKYGADKVKQVAVSTFRGSLVDAVAAEAIAQVKKDGSQDKITSNEFSIAGGKLSCKLEPSKKHELFDPSRARGLTARCMSFLPVVQYGGVVRGIPGQDDKLTGGRLIQIGWKLYEAKCWEAGAKEQGLNVSLWEQNQGGELEKVMKAVMSDLPKTDLGDETRANLPSLLNPEAKDEAFFKNASKKCDELIEPSGAPRTKSGPAGGGKKDPFNPATPTQGGGGRSH